VEPITKIEAPARAVVESEAESTLPRRVIKRYSNRKLYDTKDSRYVTLLQIAELVRAGDEVQIIDNNSKEDLTEVTLAQIIYEEQKAKEKTLPLKTLKDLIHQRTEDVLSSLREGPIGRLIPGAPGKDGEVPAVDELPKAPTVAPKPSLVDQAKEKLEDIQGAIQSGIDERVKKFEDFQHTITHTIQTTIDERVKKFEDFQHTITHTIDERVNAVLPTVLPWLELEKQVKTLSARIEELEAQAAAKEAVEATKQAAPKEAPAKKKK
jgi:polyhydroxyalkanoate synthesis repressor PhaR